MQDGLAISNGGRGSVVINFNISVRRGNAQQMQVPSIINPFVNTDNLSPLFLSDARRVPTGLCKIINGYNQSFAPHNFAFCICEAWPSEFVCCFWLK